MDIHDLQSVIKCTSSCRTKPTTPMKELNALFLFPSYISNFLFLICLLLLIFIFVSLPSLYGSFPFLKQVPKGSHFIRLVNGSNRANPMPKSCIGLPLNLCKYQEGSRVYDGTKKPLYSKGYPFQRNAWNYIKKHQTNTDKISSWKWVPKHCELPQINPHLFLKSVRNTNIGFVGYSLNENMSVSFLCILQTTEEGAKKWKRKGAWKGVYFPKFNVTVGYH